jgi:transcriptional regulator with XRE-family HTH domain
MFEHVPELLRRLRLAAHWSQQELAERSGVSVSQLSRIENGQ